eukprot:6177544-Pleurochrysis_carterae.AAC.1
MQLLALQIRPRPRIRHAASHLIILPFAECRHAGFCDTRQLYNMEEDPLEQRNLVHQKAALYQELFALIRAHVERVEASNPAVARTLTQPPESHACAINA